MKKIEYLTLVFVVSGAIFFLFGLEVLPERLQFQEFLNLASQNDIIIVVNSGGWGNTPLEEAQDFAPIIQGIQKTLKEQGYNSIVISYNRTSDTLKGKLAGMKDFLNFFDSSSEILAKDLEYLAENLPDKKIIVAGLSSGGTFVDQTYEKISEKTKSSVYAITAGTPFWYSVTKSKNILQLTNNGEDTLSTGEVKSLLFSLIKAPFRWISSKISGQDLPFPLAFRAPGHEYSWSSPEVGPQIITFLEDKFH